MSITIEVGDTIVFGGYTPIDDVRLPYPSRHPELRKGMLGVVVQVIGENTESPVLRISWEKPLRRAYDSAEHHNCWAVLASEVTKSKAHPKVDKVIKKINDMYERQPYYKKVLLGEWHA